MNDSENNIIMLIEDLDNIIYRLIKLQKKWNKRQFPSNIIISNTLIETHVMQANLIKSIHYPDLLLVPLPSDIVLQNIFNNYKAILKNLEIQYQLYKQQINEKPVVETTEVPRENKILDSTIGLIANQG